MSIIHITIKGGFDMKKIIISLLIIGSLTTGSVFAYNKNVELNTEEYISLINTNIAELNAEVEPKEKANMGTIFLNGIDEGYIIPSINNDTKLKNCISELVNNIKDTKIFNKKLQNKQLPSSIVYFYFSEPDRENQAIAPVFAGIVRKLHRK